MCYLFIEVTDILSGVTHEADGALYTRIVARLETVLVDICHGVPFPPTDQPPRDVWYMLKQPLKHGCA